MSHCSRRAGALYRGLVFDLDGTLVDTLGEITAALNEALSAVGEKPRAPREVRRWVGDGVASLVARALPDADERIRRSVQKLVVDRFAANGGGRSLPYSGILEVLWELKKRGIAMAVLSNKVEEAALAQVQRTFGDGLFSAVRGLVEPEHRKPDPASLLELVAILGLEPGSVAMVGDTEVDLQTARAARISAIAVTWGFRDRGDLVDRSPDYVVETPSELLAIMRIESHVVRIVRCDGSSGFD